MPQRPLVKIYQPCIANETNQFYPQNYKKLIVCSNFPNLRLMPN